jgi:gluconolactonase
MILTRPPSPSKSASLASALALALVAAACSNAPTHGGHAGSGGGAAGTPGAAGGGSAGNGTAGSPPGTAGQNGAAGAEAGANGSAGSTGGSGAGGASAAGTSGAAGGSAGAAGGGGSTGTAGSSPDGGTMGGAGSGADGGAPHRQYNCPPGPYPAQMMGASKNACVGFQFNYNYVEGPTWVPGQNAFFFSNFVHSNPGGMAGGDIIKVDMDGTCTVWAHDVGTNGLAVTAKGNIVAACHKTRSVTEFDIVTKQPRIVSDMYMGQKFDSPNDIVEHSNGTIYFTNPDYELGGRPPGFGPAIFMIDPSGVVSLILKTGGEPNGIGLSPDEKKLYVVGGGVWNLDDNGVPTTKTSEGGPAADGFATDCTGKILVNGTNSAFGGPDGKTLIVVSGMSSVKLIPMTVPGLP